MTINKLASMIAKREGKKHQASIGDIREALKVVAALEIEWLMSTDGDEASPLEILAKYAMVQIDKMKKPKPMVVKKKAKAKKK